MVMVDAQRHAQSAAAGARLLLPMSLTAARTTDIRAPASGQDCARALDADAKSRPINAATRAAPKEELHRNPCLSKKVLVMLTPLRSETDVPIDSRRASLRAWRSEPSHLTNGATPSTAARCPKGSPAGGQSDRVLPGSVRQAGHARHRLEGRHGMSVRSVARSG